MPTVDPSTTLFGPTPQQVAAQNAQGGDNFALQLAQMDPLTSAKYMIGSGVQNLGRGLFDIQDPNVIRAQQTQQAMAGVDTNDPSALLQAAVAMRAIDPARAAAMVREARSIQQQQADTAYKSAQGRQSDAKATLDLAQAQKALRENPNMATVVAGVDGKDGSWRQEYLYDKTNPTAPKIPVGPPYQIPAGMTIHNEAAPAYRDIIDPNDPTRMITIDGRKYTGGSYGDPGVIGIAGKEPTAAAKEVKKEEGKSSLQLTIDALRGYYKELDSMHAIQNSDRGALSNIGTATQSSSVGQFLGEVTGTKAQQLRDQIKSTRTQLLNDIRNATGMTGSQINSDAELRTWLSTVTDPTKMVGGNYEILDNIEKKYVKNQVMNPNATKPLNGVNNTTTQSVSQPFVAKTPADVKALYAAGSISKERAKTILKDMGF